MITIIRVIVQKRPVEIPSLQSKDKQSGGRDTFQLHLDVRLRAIINSAPPDHLKVYFATVHSVDPSELLFDHCHDWKLVTVSHSARWFTPLEMKMVICAVGERDTPHFTPFSASSYWFYPEPTVAHWQYPVNLSSPQCSTYPAVYDTQTPPPV